MRRARRFGLFLLLAAVSSAGFGSGAGPLPAAPPPTTSPPKAPKPDEGAALHPVPDLVDGFQLLYEQRFPDARAKFGAWSRANPDDPFGDAALAASYLFEELNRQGVMTSDYFLDDRRFLRGIDGEPDPGRMKEFRVALDRARAGARRRLKRDPSDPEALFVLTLAAGMQSNALSILEKRHLDGLGRLKEANRHAEALLARRPGEADAWLALGSANYVIGSLSGPTRFLLWFGGFHGDKELGMEQLRKTAAGGNYLRPYAKMLLALAARREGQDDLARRLLAELTREFPDSPLFASEYARAVAPSAPKGRP